MTAEISKVQIRKIMDDCYSFEIECVGGITIFIDAPCH